MKSMTVIRSTGTPRLRAACSFCPRACTQLPKRVRASRNVPMMPMTRNHSIDIRKPSSSGPDMALLKAGGIVTVIGNPPVSAISTPRQTSMVPSVTTKEWILNRTTRKPLMAPRPAPTRMAAGAATAVASHSRASARRRRRR